jgi:hypothetical protein
MSMELDAPLYQENCEECLKCEHELEPESESDSESESESESEAESESELKVELDLYWWESIPVKDLKESDFASRYEDHPCTFHFACPQFVYKNKAMRKEEEDTKNAVDAYLKAAKNISVRFSLLILLLILCLTLLICFCTLHSPSMLSRFHA